MIKGNYTITNAQSSRKIYDRADHFWPDGVGAIGGGYFADQIWRIEPTTPEGTYTITNVHSGRRLYAHTGKEFCDGFGTTMGIVQEDQKWYIQQTGDSCIIMNALSSRKLIAQGGGGDVGALAEAQSLPDQQWYLQEEPVAPI